MANLVQLCAPPLAALVLLAGCDSTSPASGRLQVEGQILEAGQAPVPPLNVEVQAWPAAGRDVASLQTDAAGRYQAELGPFPDGLIDSLVVRVIQDDCESQITTELRRRDLAPGEGNALTLPTLALSYRLPSAQFRIGGAVCAAIVTSTTAVLIGDYARLSLWIDEASDSVRGRWRLNHSASIGDDYGYFSGSLDLDPLVLQLRPTQPTPCTGLQVVIPVGGDNGSTMGAANLTGDGSCFVPNATVRFFEGAILSEVLPPAVKSLDLES